MYFKQRKELLKQKKGLSYIELMAVIVILGIILTATISYMVNTLDDGELASAQQEAQIMTDLVSEYIQLHGNAPVVCNEYQVEPDCYDYLHTPRLLDLAKINNSMTDTLEGNFYIYGYNNEVFYDYPERYIGQKYFEYIDDVGVAPIIEGTNFIDVKLMYEYNSDNYESLVFAPQTSYTLLDDGSIRQVPLQQEIEARENSFINQGDDKPTKPIVIPNRAAPYYTNTPITFTAQSYYKHGEIRYDWDGDFKVDGNYTQGVHVIKVTAYSIDDPSIRSETTDFELTIGAENKPPSKPKVGIEVKELGYSDFTRLTNNAVADGMHYLTGYSANDNIRLTATATDPDGDSISYKWLGKSNNGKYQRGENIISVYAVDSLGNISEKEEITIELENAKPILVNVEHISPIYLDTPVEFNPIIEDADGDFTEWEIVDLEVNPLDPQITYKDEGSGGLSRDNLYPIGTHTIHYLIKDSYGAEVEETYEFSVLNRMPSIPLTITMTPDTNLRPSTNVSWSVSGSTDIDNHDITYQWENRKQNYGFGTHTVRVRAVDHLGGASQWVSRVFSVTNTPPTRPNISMSPTSGLRPDTRITFTTSGSIDGEGDNFHYEYKVGENGTWSRTTPNGVYGFGSYTIYVRAVDEWGAASSTNSISFDLSNTPPTRPNISMSPTNGLRPNTRITFTASGVVDNEGDSFHYEYKVGENGSWSKTVPNGTYGFGSHTIYVRAVDEWGSASSTNNVSFDITNTAPTRPNISMNPTSGLRPNTNITFTASGSRDNEGDSFNYEYKVGDGSWSRTIPNGKYGFGNHTIYVRAVDQWGSASSTNSISFNISSVPPTKPNIVMSPSSNVRPDTTVTFTASGSIDPDGDSLHYEYKVGNGIWTTTRPSRRFDFGTHTVQARAIDEWGYVSPIETIEFEVTNTAPSRPSISMTPRNGLRPETRITFTASGSIDNEKDTFNYEYKVGDNGSWSRTVPNGTYDFGSHTIYVRAVDKWGSISSTNSISFNISNLPPTQPKLTMTPSSNIRPNTTVSFNASGSTDADGDNFHYEYRVGNGSWTRTKPSRQFALGSHRVQARAIDVWGAVSPIETLSFEVVNTAPSRPNISMTPSSEIRPSTNVRFTASGSKDNEGDDFHYEYKVGSNGSWSRSKPDGKFNFGSHTIYVRAVDEWGAISSTNSISFNIVNKAPSKPRLSMSPSSNIRPNTTVTFNATGSVHEYGDSFHYEYRVGNGSWTKTRPSRQFAFGSHTVYARAVDEWGYVSEIDSITVSVTNSAPTRPNISMSPSTNLNANTSITFTASGSTDSDGDSFTYQWRLNSGSWGSSKPGGRFPNGSHTVRVRTVDEWGTASPENSITFTVSNSPPTQPEFTISSVNAITPINPVISKHSTDPDGDTITYYWRLNSGGWTTTRPTSILPSGTNTLELRARDSQGLYSSVFTRNFWVNEITLTRNITLGPSSSRTQSGSFTVPYDNNYYVNSVTANTGSVTHSTSGKVINFTASNGTYYSREEYINPQKDSTFVTHSRLTNSGAHRDSLPYSVPFGTPGGYNGTLYKTGETPVLDSGSPPHTQYITEVLEGSLDELTSSTSYNNGTYTGILYQIGGHQFVSGSLIHPETRTSTTTHYTKSCNTIPGFSLVNCVSYGYYFNQNHLPLNNLILGSYNNLPLGQSAQSFMNHVAYIAENLKSQYNIPRDEYILPLEVTFQGVTYRANFNHNYNYYNVGTNYRPGRDTRVFQLLYGGNVSKPDTRKYRQKYSGTLYRPGIDYRNHQYRYDTSISYTIY